MFNIFLNTLGALLADHYPIFARCWQNQTRKKKKNPNTYFPSNHKGILSPPCLPDKAECQES